MASFWDEVVRIDDWGEVICEVLRRIKVQNEEEILLVDSRVMDDKVRLKFDDEHDMGRSLCGVMAERPECIATFFAAIKSCHFP
jgi:hypothetical protein